MPFCCVTAPTFAAPLTCQAFKDRLIAVIHAQGDLVAPPGPFNVAYQGEADPHVRYGYNNIVGLKGSLNCQAGDTSGDMEGFVHMAGNQDDRHKGKRRFALASAALCTLEPMPAERCGSIVLKVAFEALVESEAAKARGETEPTGDQDEDVTPKTRLNIGFNANGPNFTVHQKAPPHD